MGQLPVGLRGKFGLRLVSIVSDPSTNEKLLTHTCIVCQEKTNFSAQQRLNVIQSRSFHSLSHSSYVPHIIEAVANTCVLGHVNLPRVNISIEQNNRHPRFTRPSA